MPPTLRDLVAAPALGLSVVAHEDGLDAFVRWAHATELADPTPYLEGGELVLTTGMRMTKSAPAANAYVKRLVKAGVVGLGLGVGTGLSHRSVPSALVKACDGAGLPLLEVPEATPFIQVSKTVSDLLAAEERDQLARSLTAQRALTKAALSPDRAGAVVARLAREIGGWALVVTPRGDVVHATPARALDHRAELMAEVERLRPKGMHAGSSSSSGGERIVVQPLGVQGRPHGYLAAGAPEPWKPSVTGIVNTAVSLLSLEGERGGEDRSLHRAVRTAAVALIVAGHGHALPLTDLGWQGLDDAQLVVLVGRGPAEALTEGAERIEEAVGSALAAVLSDELVVAVTVDSGDDVVAVEALREVGSLRIGRAEGCGIDDLAAAARRAGQAAASPMAAVGQVSDYLSLAGVGLLDLVERDAAEGFSESMLAPLDAHSAADDLLASLDAWLGRHGQWDAAAQELGIHRHTLRHRIRRIEQILDRSLDDPAVRMDMWFALRQRDQRPPAAT